MEPQTSKTSNFNIPVAIIIAGLLVAGAIYLKDKRVDIPPTDGQEAAGVKAAQEINLPALTPADHIKGNPNSTITFFEYSDFDCPFCRNFHPVTEQLLNEYGKDGKLALVYRHFPLTELHPNAAKKAAASECVNELGGNDAFWKFADAMFKGPQAHADDPTAELVAAVKKLGLDDKKFSTCFAEGRYTDVVEKQYTDAVAAGGRGTPYNILSFATPVTNEMKTKLAAIFSKYPSGTFIVSTDGKRISLNGALPLADIKQAVDLILANAK